MTLDLFAILVNAVARSIDATDEIQHVLSVVLIGIALGVGTWWALSVLSTSFIKTIFVKLI